MRRCRIVIHEHKPAPAFITPRVSRNVRHAYYTWAVKDRYNWDIDAGRSKTRKGAAHAARRAADRHPTCN